MRRAHGSTYPARAIRLPAALPLASATPRVDTIRGVESPADGALMQKAADGPDRVFRDSVEAVFERLVNIGVRREDDDLITDEERMEWCREMR